MAKANQHLTTELAQQQRLIPLQVQYGRLLEMNGPEFEEEVARALDEMPALEAVDNNDTPDSSTEDGEAFTESALDLQRADFSNDDDMPDTLRSSAGYYDSERYAEPVVTDDGVTLLDTLADQIAERRLDDHQRRIALYIAGNIDHNGYLTRSVDALVTDLAINEMIDTSPEEVEEMLRLVQSLEPAGVGASDLRECLLLQLEHLEPSQPQSDAEDILTNYYQLFSNRNFHRLASRSGLSAQRLRDALDLIGHLNPKPGSTLDSESYLARRGALVPDFAVEADANGHITVTLLSRIPELQIESTFAADPEEPAAGASRATMESYRAARSFIRQNRDDARSFIRLVKMRNSTLFAVMEAIAKLQSAFFLTDDDETIRPMVLRDVAELTGLDLSVISRATQGKHVVTSRGAIYPLKKFFNEKPRQATDDTLTANRIVAAIRQVIEEEDPSHPLSDRQITDLLTARGFDIARRTVSKYRENMGVPTGRLRKRL